MYLGLCPKPRQGLCPWIPPAFLKESGAKNFLSASQILAMHRTSLSLFLGEAFRLPSCPFRQTNRREAKRLPYEGRIEYIPRGKKLPRLNKVLCGGSGALSFKKAPPINRVCKPGSVQGSNEPICCHLSCPAVADRLYATRGVKLSSRHPPLGVASDRVYTCTLLPKCR